MRIKSAQVKNAWLHSPASEFRIDVAIHEAANSLALKKARDARRKESAQQTKFLLSLFSSLLQDLRCHFRDVAYLVRRTRGEGMVFLTSRLPELAKACEKGISNGIFQLPSSFKRASKDSGLPAFLGNFFLKVFHPSGALRTDADHQAVFAIRQVCYLAYKAELPRDPALDKAVVERFVQVEQELSTVHIKDDAILRFASLLLDSITAGYSGVSHPRHGPGVSANVPIHLKNEARLSPLPGVREYPLEFFLNLEDAWTRWDRYPVYRTGDYWPQTTQNVAKVILVPKDSRGPRLISAEPFENQYLQQGVASWLVDKAESHRLSAGRVNFTDQSINQKLAKEASSSLYWATLDLKDASDRVSMELVRKLFRNQRLIADIERLRSTHTRIPNVDAGPSQYFEKPLLLHKHAPMGSALCFPIMALSIWSLSVSALAGMGVENPEEKVYVYGDDVIVPSDYAHVVINVLERYHLRVNADKSFIRSRFAESCGVDAFDGQDVTPIRLHQCDISKKPNLKNQAPEVLVALVAKANLFTNLRFTRTAEFLYREPERWLGPLPYGHRSSPYLCRWASKEIEDHLPEANAFRKGLLWRKGKPYNPLGVDLVAWAIEPLKTENPQESLQGALMGRLRPTRTTSTHRVRGRHGWSYVSVPDFVGADPNVIDFGYVTKPKQFKLSRRRFDNYAMSPIPPWDGSMLIEF